jgi:hypothetical protein
MSRYSKKKTPVYMRNEMRLRELAGGFCGNLVSLVWSGVLLHSHVLLACLHGLNATNEVVMCYTFFLFPFSLENPPAKWVTRTERTGRQQISESDRPKRTMGIQNKKRFKLPVLSCPGRVQVIRSGIDLICRLRGTIHSNSNAAW